MHRSKWVGILLSAVLVAGCTKADKNPNAPDGVNGDVKEDANVTFYVKSLNGDAVLNYPNTSREGTEGSILASDWRVPTAATFTFSACIEDRATRKEAIGHRFEVFDVESKSQVVDVTPTRPNGCFTWMETHPFSFFVKKSRWVVVERDIVGVGIHTGRQRVRLALNPWTIGHGARENGSPVYYLRDNALPSNLTAVSSKSNVFASEGSHDEDSLFVDEVSVQNIRRGERETGIYVQMKITMEPKIRFENSVGIPSFRKIESGQFDVIGHLVLNDSGSKLKDRVILSGDGNADVSGAGQATPRNRVFARVEDGKLVAWINAWIDPRLPQGNLEFAVKLIPRGVRGLKSFDGIYELGSLGSLSGSRSGSLSQTCRESRDGCSVASYLMAASNFEELHKKALASYNSPYLFDRLRLRFVQVQPGETTMRRTVAYSASTCVIDAFTGDRVVNLPFTIKYKDTGEVIRKATAEDGCLNWDSTIFHEYYQPEEFIEKVVTISRDTGVSRDLRFYINPWDDKFTFGFDEREFTPDFWERLKRRKKIKSRFFLADYGYHTVKFQYNIDSLMSLEVRKTVLMELQPQVLRYSGIINARKMTEQLRDGIWLLKVGIQKNYLDPAQAGLVTDTLQRLQEDEREKHDEERKKSSDRLETFGVSADKKEYISTKTALVRVTDGVIIQPVELKMQDLRMMRVRSNMMIQLEAVDELKLQSQNAFHEGLKTELDDLLKRREKLREDLGKDNGFTEDEKALLKAEEERIRTRVEDRKKLTRRVFDEINRQLNSTGNFKVNLDTFQLSDEQMAYLKPLLEKIDLELQKNDFTNIRLPECLDGYNAIENRFENSCDIYASSNAGLERRSFVGPVIFLSNAYKDSVRATDNIDEAGCGRKVEFDDAFEKEIRNSEIEAFSDVDRSMQKDRQNTFYNFSKYFGSLRHLCGSHVDDLIAREGLYRRFYQKSGAAVASIFEFAKTNNLNFLSLADEKPKYVELTTENLERCNYDLNGCMRETDERSITTSSALEAVNKHLQTAYINMTVPWRWVSSNVDDVKLSPWDKDDLRMAFFENSSPRATRYASCAVIASSTIEAVQKGGGRLVGYQNWNSAEAEILSRCLNAEGALNIDKKLRVFKTGENGDSYIFLGGLQLNLNVGQSFSVSRSDSFSGSAGVEAFDFVGYFGKGPAGVLLKPLSLKVSRSHSFSNSDGTSVSDSTYLVAQIAGFKVRLDDYERCNVITMKSDYLKSYLSRGPNYFGAFVSANAKIIHQQKGLLICEGVHNDPSKPRFVKESYYYFTQHFTEGDMLDQADLYNHPWLLALRGRRDFGVFLSLIRAQEAITFGNAVSGYWNGAQRGTEWPLEQMLTTYKQITPSFPGFYTDLEDSESDVAFPLERRRLIKYDHDVNCEVKSCPESGGVRTPSPQQ